MLHKLIVLEGLDGSGKSTQWELLKTAFPQLTFIAFPDYSSDSGRIISRYLAGELGGDAYAASSFYAVDRYISYTSHWRELLKQGGVISARYTSSNAIYQMAKLPENEWDGYLDWLCDYEFGKLKLPAPDLTLLLDVLPETAQKLLDKRYSGDSGARDIHEGDVEYQRTCRKAAFFAAKRGNWRVVDCMNGENLREPADINADLARIISDYI